MHLTSRIYVAGHQGLVGSALIRALEQQRHTNLVMRTMQQLDLRNQNAVNRFFDEERPEYVFVAAARVGGIKANMQFPASFIYDNLMIQSNILHAAYEVGVKKLLFLGSSCIYPRLAPQPITEDALLTGPLEPTNEYYALAKIAGLKMCEAYRTQYGVDFISAMPTNLYGPHDNFNPQESHVIPALIYHMIEAERTGVKELSLWGTGRARREFLYVDDCVQALLSLMNHYSDDRTINIGTGVDLSIEELAQLIKELVGYRGNISFDDTVPDGMPRKVLEVSRIQALGWAPRISLTQGLRKTIDWYYNHSDRCVPHSSLVRERAL